MVGDHTQNILFSYMVWDIWLKITHKTFYLQLYGMRHMVGDHTQTFYLQLYGMRHMVGDHTHSWRSHPKHFIYSYMVWDIWLEITPKTFYLQLYGMRRMVKDHTQNILFTVIWYETYGWRSHPKHFIYSYMVWDIWLEITSKTFYLQLYGMRHMVGDHPQNILFTVIWYGRKEGRNVLFNDALNTFYLLLYGIRYMVKNHSDKERGNLLPPHGLLFPICSKGSFICTIPQTG